MVWNRKHILDVFKTGFIWKYNKPVGTWVLSIFCYWVGSGSIVPAEYIVGCSPTKTVLTLAQARHHYKRPTHICALGFSLSIKEVRSVGSSSPWYSLSLALLFSNLDGYLICLWHNIGEYMRVLLSVPSGWKLSAIWVLWYRVFSIYWLLHHGKRFKVIYIHTYMHTCLCTCISVYVNF